MAPVHARLSIRDGQLQIEEMSSNGEIFVQLAAPYCLQNSDQLIVGRHSFQYRERPADQPGSPLSAELVLLKGDISDGQKVFELGNEYLIVGRSAGSWTFPSDGIMSRAHAKVYRLSDDFFVEDLGSRNGTFLKVSGAAAVPPGTAVLIGNQRFKVKRL
jgi:pSer/pThr/pTyr-binding forkhead associated (FHA) protein